MEDNLKELYKLYLSKNPGITTDLKVANGKQLELFSDKIEKLIKINNKVISNYKYNKVIKKFLKK